MKPKFRTYTICPKTYMQRKLLQINNYYILLFTHVIEASTAKQKQKASNIHHSF